MTRPKDPKRPLLVGGLLLMALGAGLEIWSRTQPPGGIVDSLAPWLVLAGSMLTLLYFVVRRAAKAPVPDRDKRESMLFGQSTQMEDPSRTERD